MPIPTPLLAKQQRVFYILLMNFWICSRRADVTGLVNTAVYSADSVKLPNELKIGHDSSFLSIILIFLNQNLHSKDLHKDYIIALFNSKIYVKTYIKLYIVYKISIKLSFIRLTFS